MTGIYTVYHPTIGNLEIRTYHQVTSPPGAAPSSGPGSFAIYQEGRAVGYLQSGDEVTFGPGPGMAGPILDLGDNRYIDRYGNLYIIGDGVTVLTPTDQGYDSRGTMPGTGHPFNSVEKLTLDANGEPTIVVRNNGHHDDLSTYRWIDGEFRLVD